MFLAATGDQYWVRKDSWWDSWGASLCYQVRGKHRVSLRDKPPPETCHQHLTHGGRTKGRTRAWTWCFPVLWIKGKRRQALSSHGGERILLIQDRVGRTRGTPHMETGQFWAKVHECLTVTAWCFSFLGDLVFKGWVPSCVLWPLPNASFGTLKTVEYFLPPLHSSSINFCGLSILLRYWGFSHSIEFSFQYCELFFLGKEGGFDNIQWFFWNFCNNFGLIVIGMSFFTCIADVSIYTALTVSSIFTVSILCISDMDEKLFLLMWTRKDSLFLWEPLFASFWLLFSCCSETFWFRDFPCDL